LAVEGGPAVPAAKEPDHPRWQRWNDYGIGLLNEGRPGGTRGELRQAIAAFAEVEKLGRFDGPLNMARAYYTEGQLKEATEAAERAAAYQDREPYVGGKEAFPHWRLAWISGLINRQQGNLEEAEREFLGILQVVTPQMKSMGFDFSKDYRVINELGGTIFDQAKKLRTARQLDERQKLLKTAAEQFERTLTLEPEDMTAHYNLQLIYEQLGETKKSAEHGAKHRRYKPDDNAQQAVAKARKKYPHGDFAAEAIVIYPLQRRGAPELPADLALTSTDQPETRTSDD
jgi:tetratricopeptide (TPR) repeat protein